MPAGSTLDRYQYLSRLGAGGSSTVHLAEDTLLGRRVALKRIHAPDDVSARSRLRREALIGASLSHSNLISVFDIVTTDEGADVIVMEYVDGETLADRLADGRKLDVDEALPILTGVASALDAIHAERIVHRDVKPSNILLGSDGSVKLADLGIAAARNRTQITTTGAVMGTFSYMAPEQLEGADATPAVDVYALAAVAYEVLGGKKARHEDNPLALAHAIATQPPPDVRNTWREAPAAAADVLGRGMSRDPGRRPDSAGGLIARLRAAVERKPPAAVERKPPAAVERKPPAAAVGAGRRSRAPVLAAVATLLAAAVAAVVVLAVSGGSGGGAPSRSGHRAQSAGGRGHAPSAAPAGAASGAPSGAGSPVSAVESFYRLAASHQFASAWALADPAFRQQLQGYEGFESTMARDRSIVFHSADVVNQSAGNAAVTVHTTSIQDSGTQNCSGTVDLVHGGGSAVWLLDHIDINCV